MTALLNANSANLCGQPIDADPQPANKPIARHLVHCVTSEVLITSLAKAGDAFRVGARWPREHAAFGPRAGFHDPMLLVETVRQAGMALAHTFFAVPETEKIIWQDVSYSVMASGLRVPARPVDLELRIKARDVRRRGARVAGMRLTFTCHRDGVLIASGETTWNTVTPAAYARLRGNHHGNNEVTVPLAPAVAPERVGRTREADVLLADTPVPDTYALRLDQSNTAFFDHANDHVPGVVVGQAAQQAAVLALGRSDAVPVRGDLAFSRYLELDEPCEVTVERRVACGAVHPVTVIIKQAGHTAVTCQFDVLVHG